MDPFGGLGGTTPGGHRAQLEVSLWCVSNKDGDSEGDGDDGGDEIDIQ